MRENHYDTLGLNESASDEDIKKAYRKLAMQHHPDKNPGNKESEDRFKQINEAYATLGDSAKRAEYDQMRRFGGGGAHTFRQGGQEFHFSFGDGGFNNIDDMIRNMFAQHGFGDPFGAHHNARRNRDLQITVELSMEEAFTGKDLPISFKANGQDVSIVVRIPAGIPHGTRLRFQGHGDKNIPNVPPGDLYVTVAILPHPTFRRDGPHLHTDLVVDALDAIVGHSASIKCIDGTTISLTIPAGTHHGAVLRVKEKGMPMHNNAKQLGDLYVNVAISIPRTLSPQHMADLQKIVDERRLDRK